MTDTLLKIDDELKGYIPSLSDEEYSLLEESILSEGCRDPIVTWSGWILDGHNRYEICCKHNITFATVEKTGLQTKDDVKIWMIRNQIGRRNLTDFQRTELALKLKPLLERKAKENQNFGLETSGKRHEGKVLQNSAKPIERINTTEEIAKSAGVSRDTVQKVQKVLNKAEPEIIEKARSGEISINAAAKTVTPPKPVLKQGDMGNPILEPADEVTAEQPEKIIDPEPEGEITGSVNLDDAFSDGPTLEELIDETQRENEQLHKKIESLTKDDKDAEIARLQDLNFALSRQIDTLTTTKGQAEKSARYATGKLLEIGDMVGDRDFSTIVESVRKALGK